MKQFYLLCAVLAGNFMLQAQDLAVDVQISNAVCGSGGCTTLYANYPSVGATTSYTVSAQPFSPPFPTTGGVLLSNNNDDVWSPAVLLPFGFSFYGNTYNQLLVGSNGVITFDFSGHAPLGGCPWMFSAPIPSTGFPIKNAIYGVYQDTDIRQDVIGLDTEADVLQNANYYTLDTGVNSAPNRIFVANFNKLPLFQCNVSAALQTTQIVLHEGSNIIDVYVFNRTACTTWNGGNGVIGVQNQAGTQAVTPPGRNTGSWSASNEAWRFTPNGSATPAVLTWYDGDTAIGNTSPLEYCIDASTTVFASVQYEGMAAPVMSMGFPLEVYEYDLQNPENIVVCTPDSAPFVADLTSNTSIVLAAMASPQNFAVTYHSSAFNATNDLPPIAMPAAYLFDQDMTIYMRAEELSESGCSYVLPFQLLANPVPDAPTGAATQTFTPGQTLGNLLVTGQNIQWYDAAQGGNLLASNTVLVNNVTYYASQTVADCESRMSPGRLAVTAVTSLGIAGFTATDLKLYPNPASATLNLQFPQEMDHVSIYDLVGQQVMSRQHAGQNVVLDVNELASGTYFVKIRNAQGTVVSKFVKK